jgi:hypothetical protein
MNSIKVPICFTNSCGYYSEFSADRLLCNIKFNMTKDIYYNTNLSDIILKLLNPPYVSKRILDIQLKNIKTKKDLEYIFTDIIYRKNDIIEIKHIHVDKYGDCIPFNPNNLHLPNNHLFGIVLETIYEKNKFIGYNILRLNLKEQIVMFIPSWCGVFTKKIMEIN